MQNKIRTLRCLLTWIQDNNMPFSKIMVHKSMFYLREKRLKIPFRFDFMDYGPFSSELRETVEFLVDQGEVATGEMKYRLTYCFTQKRFSNQEILDALYEFKEMANNDFSFDNLNILGVTLYSILAIKNLGLPPVKDEVLKDVAIWNREVDQKVVESMYDRLIPVWG